MLWLWGTKGRSGAEGLWKMILSSKHPPLLPGGVLNSQIYLLSFSVLVFSGLYLTHQKHAYTWLVSLLSCPNFSIQYYSIAVDFQAQLNLFLDSFYELICQMPVYYSLLLSLLKKLVDCKLGGKFARYDSLAWSIYIYCTLCDMP